MAKTATARTPPAITVMRWRVASRVFTLPFPKRELLFPVMALDIPESLAS